MLTSGSPWPCWTVDPIARFDQFRPSSSPEDPNGRTTTRRSSSFHTLPLETGCSSTTSSSQRVLQVGIHVANSLTEVCDVSLGTPGVLLDRFVSSQKNREFKLKYFRKLFDTNNILCLQEVQGKDEYLQAVQVLAPRFRFFGTFNPGNENAGGSAICIHKELLPEDAIVTHMITCQGRDHIVSIQSGRQSLVIVNVHFEPELTLRRSRERIASHHCTLAVVSHRCGHHPW